MDTYIPHVVIVGGGFGGLHAAKALSKSKVRVTLIDRTNHHLFQPLLYQVAMAGLSPAEIAAPIRSILAQQKNTCVWMSEVKNIDLKQRHITLSQGNNIAYDYLVLATGAKTNYFAHPEWETHALGLKNIQDAIRVRERVLYALECAEKEENPKNKKSMLTFIVIGGGPTGVELAGALYELSRFIMARDFKRLKNESAKVILIEGGPRVLSSFPEHLSEKALKSLHTHTQVIDVTAQGIKIRHANSAINNSSEEAFLDSQTVLFGAGVCATSLTQTLGVELDKLKRVIVSEDLSIPGYPEAFAIGDCAAFTDVQKKVLPGIAPVAIQQGKAVARIIIQTMQGKKRESFTYANKGSLATIGRSRAIADFGKLQLSGFLAWLMWLAVHIFMLIGFRNRLIVMIQWMWLYFTYQRGARLITHEASSLYNKPKAFL